MAWTLAEVQTLLTAAKATYLSLLKLPTSQRKIDGREVTEKDMAAMRAEIDSLHELEAAIDPDSAGPSPTIGGQSYASFDRF